jgi:hypothetical protein
MGEPLFNPFSGLRGGQAPVGPAARSIPLGASGCGVKNFSFHISAPSANVNLRWKREENVRNYENGWLTQELSYVPTRSRKGEVLEDNLDCPLVELELLQTVGERPAAESNRHEPIYAFRVEEKPEISPDLFIYSLDDFWNKRHSQEKTLSFRDLAVAEGSPGQVFKLPEHAIRERLESIEKDSAGKFPYQESAAFQQVIRAERCSPLQLLKQVYRNT